MVHNELFKIFSLFKYLEMLVFLIYGLFYHVCIPICVTSNGK